MTQKFTLIFPSLNSLYGFVREFTINYIDMNDNTCMLVCECDDAAIETAKDKYGAKLA
ncbi:MAG TPA: hypothetical protein VL095_07760 [Flavisolibacter sp.]|nr:hypothetical protein [Flavisolibacter sp.]